MSLGSFFSSVFNNITLRSADKEPIKLEGEATVWDDLRIAGFSLGTAASAPDSVALIGNIVTPHFDGNATMEQMYFQMQLPHTWKEGSTVLPHVHWCPSSTGTGTVQWFLEFSKCTVGGTLSIASTISVTATISAASPYQMLIASFPSITMTGCPISTMIIGRLFRDPSTDTYAADAALLELDFHYEIDSMGSREEFIK